MSDLYSEWFGIDDRTFLQGQLPTLPHPTVTLMREDLAMFRANYALLVRAVSAALGTDEKSLRPVDVVRWLEDRGCQTDD